MGPEERWGKRAVGGGGRAGGASPPDVVRCLWELLGVALEKVHSPPGTVFMVSAESGAFQASSEWITTEERQPVPTRHGNALHPDGAWGVLGIVAEAPLSDQTIAGRPLSDQTIADDHRPIGRVCSVPTFNAFERATAAAASARLRREEHILSFIRRQRVGEGMRCPHCSGSHLHKWGSFRGRQRHRCQACGRTFSDLTGTPLAHTKRLDLWPHYLEHMSEQVAVRSLGARLGIHKDTAWRWRHRVMTGLLTADRGEILSGLVELREASFPHSEKGSKRPGRRPYGRLRPWIADGAERPHMWVLLGCDGRAVVLSEIIGRCRPRALDLRKILLPRCAPEAVLLPPSGPAGPYRAAVTGLQVRWRPGGIRPPSEGRRLQLDVVRTRRWFRPFHGVASKYLDRYLAWHYALERLETRGGVFSRREVGGHFLRRSVAQQLPRTSGNRARGTRPTERCLHPSLPPTATHRAAGSLQSPPLDPTDPTAVRSAACGGSSSLVPPVRSARNSCRPSRRHTGRGS